MGMDVIDVEQSNVEGLIVVTATLRLESVDLDTTVTNGYGGVGRGQENGWNKDGSEPHGGEKKGRAGGGDDSEIHGYNLQRVDLGVLGWAWQ